MHALPGTSPGPVPAYAYLLQPDLNVIAGNSVDLLEDGGSALALMLEGIRSAARSVLLEMYCFACDFVGCEFARMLAKRASEGVTIRVLIDAAGSRLAPRSFYGWMRQQGIAVRTVNPIRHMFLHGYVFRWRDHRKLIVLDERIAIVGGLNLCRAAAPRRLGGGGWRESAVRVTGPIVSELRASFEQSWGECGPEEAVPSVAAHIPRPTGNVPATLIATRPLGQRRFGDALRKVVRQARHRIWIANPYFLPPHSLIGALRGAVRRRVDVRVLVPRRSDCPFVLRAAQRLYDYFLFSGIRLFEWPGPMMHSKAAVVDGLWAVIGSHNMDPLSLLHNRELSLVFFGRQTAARFEAMFERDWELAQEVRHEQWRARGILRRWLEGFCAGFRYFY